MSLFSRLFKKPTPDDELVEAAKSGNAEQVAAALAKGARLDALDSDGCSPLVNAVYLEHEPVVRLLLERGANPNESNDSGTVVHFAALTGNLRILELLIAKGANVKGTDRKRNVTAMLVAVREGHIPVVKRLLSAGLDANEVVSEEGDTLLFSAVEKDNPEMIELLVMAGADPNVRRPDGITPLLTAAYHGQTAAARALIQAGADPLLEYKPGVSPASIAELRGHPELAAMIDNAVNSTDNPFLKKFSADDPRLAQVKELADRDMPTFLEWLSDPARREQCVFVVKCAVSDEQCVEHIWMIVHGREGDMLKGVIDSDLQDVTTVKCGDAHQVAIKDIEDLMVTDRECQLLLGGHHMKLLG